MLATDFLKQQDDIHSFAPFPAGWYTLTCDNVEERTARSSGNPYHSLEFRIHHGTGKRRCWLNLPTGSDTEGGKEFVRNMLSQLVYAAGLTVTADQSLDALLRSTEGKQVVAFLKPDGDRMELKAFDHEHKHGEPSEPQAEPSKPTPPTPPAGNFDDFDDNDIPF